MMKNLIDIELNRYLNKDGQNLKVQKTNVTSEKLIRNNRKSEIILIDLSEKILKEELKPNASSKYFKEYFHVKKLLLAAEIYLQTNNRVTVYFICKKALRQSKELRDLRAIISSLHKIVYYEEMNLIPNIKNSQAELKKLQYYLILETEIYTDHFELVKRISENKHSSEKIAEFSLSLINKYSVYKKKIPSHKYHLKLYMIYLLYYGTSNQKELIPGLINEAIKYFQEKKFNFIPGIIFCQVKLATHYLIKREFPSVEKTLFSAFKTVNDKSFHWFRLKEIQILAQLSQKNYQKAAVIFNLTKNKFAFAKKNKVSENRWKIMEAYVQVATEALDPSTKKKHFSISKFMNEVPIYSKDKRTYNVSILVAQMSLFIIRKDYDRAMERVDPLNKYASRYLKRNETFRGNCFIKMLIVIPKYNFNKLRVERHTKKLREKLSKMSLATSQQAFFSEFIPYEDLWELLINSLDAKKHYNSPITKG